MLQSDCQGQNRSKCHNCCDDFLCWGRGTGCQAHWCSTCLRRLHGRGMREQRRLAIYAYCLLNVVVFTIGFVSHLDGGFGGSLAYPVAKGGGFMLDLNLAVVVLPTLKSLQTALRSAGATREWLPSDDPIAFHVQVATLILIGSVVHIAAHAVHILKIRIRLWGLRAARGGHRVFRDSPRSHHRT